MATKTAHQKTTTKKTTFFPVAVLKHGILYHDGKMLYTDGKDRWLYVSEDGMDVRLYYSLAELLEDVYKKDDDADYVVTGWDFYPTRFTYLIDDAYNYYNARFET